MQVLQAGQHKLLLLELDPEFLGNIVKQAGFEFTLKRDRAYRYLDLTAPDRQAPLLLFDAADPATSDGSLDASLRGWDYRTRPADTYYGRQPEDRSATPCLMP